MRNLFAALRVLALAASARAQTPQFQEDPALEDEARSLFQAGRAAYDSARYEAALDYFDRAYSIVARPALLYNMGAAADRLQQSRRALELYRHYLHDMPDAANRASVERRIEFLEGVVRDEPSEHVELSATHTQPGGDITGEWWFWTLIAVVVVGAGVGITAAVIASTSSVEAPLPGTFPSTMALRWE